MSTPTNIKDPSSGREAWVSDHNALRVEQIINDVPPVGTPNRHRYYHQLLGSTGAGSGTTNQNVDGRAPAQEFYVAAHTDYDIWVTVLQIIIADTAVTHDKFGNLSALSTGWDLHVTESGEDTKIMDAVKTGGQAIMQGGGMFGFGSGAGAFELISWTGTEDAQMVNVPLGFLMPGGIRLGRGTNDRIVSTVSDLLTGLTEFTVRAIGYRHYP